MRVVALMLVVATLVLGCAKQKDVLVSVTAPGGVAAISGLVYDMGGVLAGASVTASPALPATVTDSGGRFVYQDVTAPKIYTFTVSKPGHLPASAVLGVSAGEAYQVWIGLQRTDTLRVVQSAAVSAGSEDLVVRDSIAYVATTGGVDIRDVHAGRFGARIGHVDDACNYIHRIALAGNYAYLATGYSAVGVVDVSNPAAPLLVRNLTLPGQAHDVAIDGSLLAVADNDSVIFMSLANPALPVRLGAVRMGIDGIGQGCYGISLDPGRRVAVVSSFNNGIELVRYDDPTAPVYANQVAGGLNPWAADLDLVRGVAAIAGDDGVTLLDYHDTTNPAILGSFSPGGNGGSDVLLLGDRVLFASSFNGLYLLDFANPSAPQIVSRLYQANVGSPDGLAAGGGGAWVAGYTRLSSVEIPPRGTPTPMIRIEHHPIGTAGFAAGPGGTGVHAAARALRAGALP